MAAATYVCVNNSVTVKLPLHSIFLSGQLGCNGNVVEDTVPHTMTCLCMVTRWPGGDTTNLTPHTKTASAGSINIHRMKP